jgi:hypothetical protein
VIRRCQVQKSSATATRGRSKPSERRAASSAFWNAGDEPCRILEIIAPGGFEKYFEELVDAGGPPTPELIAALGARYGIEHDIASIPALCERFGLEFGS